MTMGDTNSKEKFPFPKLGILGTHEPHGFTVPIKKINEGRDVSSFLVSKAYKDIMTFILQLNTAMFPQFGPNSSENEKSKPVRPVQLGSQNGSFSSTVQRLRNLLDDLQRIVDEVPPDPGPRRFGNLSFRKWFENVQSHSLALIERHVPANILLKNDESNVGALDEIESYFLGSFGSSERLDYGTGHELSFLAFLGCIWKLGGFENTDSREEAERSIVLGVIEPYLQLIRRLIKTYTLEPAGSHGVWGLDDHSFLPYIFGSAQYAPAISEDGEIPTEGSGPDSPNPADVAKAMTVERERTKNMYFAAIGFIYDVKKGPFWEHSPMLYDISGVPKGWAKINKGMLKMYNVEVLSKFPVVQHFKFGSLFSWDRDPTAIPPPPSVHTSNQPSNTTFPESTIPPRTAHPLLQPTNAPWASHQPGPISQTPAPWAVKPSNTGALPPTVPPRNSAQIPQRNGFQTSLPLHQPSSDEKPDPQETVQPTRDSPT